MPIIALFMILLASSLPQAQATTCVIYFERDEHPVSKQLFQALDQAKHEGVKFHLARSTQDLIACATKGFSRIMLVAHGGHPEHSHAQESYRLAFFTKVPESVYPRLRTKAIQDVQNELKNLNSQMDTKFCRDQFDSPICKELEDEVRQAETALMSMRDENTLRLAVGYEQTVILRHFWTKFYEAYLASPRTLREIRFYSCDARKSALAYPALRDLERLGVRLSSQSASGFWSFIYGKSVMSLDVEAFVQDLRQ